MILFFSFFFLAPVAGLLMKVVNPRILAISGGILSAVSILCSPLAGSIYILGIMLALTGEHNTLQSLVINT